MKALRRCSVELRPGLPIGLVVFQALRVKRDSWPRYSDDDYLQDVACKLLGCVGWDPSRGAATVFVRVVARSVLRDYARREARRGVGVKPTPPTRGVACRTSRAQDGKLSSFGVCA